MTIDYELALLDPTAIFDEPKQVVAETSLTPSQQLKILKRWEYDALELMVADEENMLGEGQGNLLRQIRTLMNELQQTA